MEAAVTSYDVIFHWNVLHTHAKKVGYVSTFHTQLLPINCLVYSSGSFQPLVSDYTCTGSDLRMAWHTCSSQLEMIITVFMQIHKKPLIFILNCIQFRLQFSLLSAMDHLVRVV